jgi:uncharacterized protein (DUF111 family)
MWTYRSLTQLECNVDDMTGETTAHVLSVLLSAGALDAWTAPIVMKKGRPAVSLCVLCEEPKTNALLEVVFRHATTLGVRVVPVRRASLHRSFVRAVPTGFVAAGCDGKVDVKMGWMGKECVNVKPEFEDCREVSEKTGAPVKVVMDAARAAVLQMAQDRR